MKEALDLNEDFDFGFSAMSEEELRATEKQLESQLSNQKAELASVVEQAEYTNKKLQGMRNMILPLLKNLMANPDKEYIYWPQRTAKIESFIKKLDKYVNES
jgi:septal ring factor EnvC (AmiA/AmiB activator)